ncbi:uncharacterized protein KQ657_004854 [Scheffersomyces spartinae]|uniref:26S proteasome complex subunit SEM1 n=1 Tax=Scheffersomyces spartinae TaxID=45513 RepID=A0A9P8AIW1_9ASCO|nr:uncharacterized protein KQ657_004854 [Scheffersomyces spartinae]KAG7194146.1 hypothetical protein KQ657_004854 [Scheffersomyces spartinae]
MSEKEASGASAPADEVKETIKTLEEDDEFEDFPEDTQWTNEPNPHLNAANLWEEDWDDDDNNDDFSLRLKAELKSSQKAAA